MKKKVMTKDEAKAIADEVVYVRTDSDIPLKNIAFEIARKMLNFHGWYALTQFDNKDFSGEGRKLFLERV